MKYDVYEIGQMSTARTFLEIDLEQFDIASISKNKVTILWPKDVTGVSINISEQKYKDVNRHRRIMAEIEKNETVIKLERGMSEKDKAIFPIYQDIDWIIDELKGIQKVISKEVPKDLMQKLAPIRERTERVYKNIAMWVCKTCI